MGAVVEKRLHHIDGIRAIAALLVVIMHAADTKDISEYTRTHGAWLYDLVREVDLGRIGVMIFFCVSGFVIPSSLKQGHSVLNFAVRRFFRLYPPYWVSMAAALYVVWYLYGRRIDAKLVLDNLTMLTIFTNSKYIEDVYWTLASELIFYGLCAALFAAGLLHRATLIAALSLTFALQYLGQLNVFLGPVFEARSFVFVFKDERLHLIIMSLSLMFLGASLRSWSEGKAGLVASIFTVGTCVTYIIAIPASCYLSYGLTPLQKAVVQTGVACPASVSVFLLLALGLKITWRPLVAIGQASYSLYLFHGVVLWGVIWYLVYYWPTATFSTLTLVLVTCAASVLLSLLTYRFVELPSNRIGRLTAAWLASRGVSHATDLSGRSILIRQEEPRRESAA